ncbi:MAG: hypothetical protein JNL63_13145 [Bacteroidia bacterium]|nr:hypothetical protein [Bacteroidia bacterium]
MAFILISIVFALAIGALTFWGGAGLVFLMIGLAAFLGLADPAFFFFPAGFPALFAWSFEGLAGFFLLFAADLAGFAFFIFFGAFEAFLAILVRI